MVKKRYRKLRRREEVTPEYPDIDYKLGRIRQISEMIRRDTETVERLKAEVIDLYRRRNLKSYHGVTFVEPERTVVDEAALERLIANPQVWAKVTERKLSPELLEAAIDRGIVSVDLVKLCTESKPVKPHLRMGQGNSKE